MRVGIKGRCVDSVSLRILPIRDYLPDFRRRNHFPASIRGFVYGAQRGGVHRHAGLFAVAGRGIGLGVAERSPDMEVNAPGVDEGLRSELSKQGVFTTTL